MGRLDSSPPLAARKPPASGLFRIEAIEHVRGQALGVVLLSRPLSYSVLTTLFAAIAMATICFLYFGSYTRKVNVPGQLLPALGVIKVMPLQGGQVAQARVTEGQVVHKGDVLFVLTNDRTITEPANDGRTMEQTVSALLLARRDSLERDRRALQQQNDQKLDAARRRVQEFAAETQRVDQQVVLQHRRIEIAKADVSRFADLVNSHFVSPVQLQSKEAELLDQQERLGDLQRARAAAANSMTNAQADVRDLLVQAERDQQAAERELAAASQALTENEARRQIFVRAPSAGVVSAIVVAPGQTAMVDQPIASILPAGSDLEAELYVPSRAVGFLRPGLQVLLRYEAYPYQKFGQSKGRVREVSRVAVRPLELNLPGAEARDEPVYRVRVTLDRQFVQAHGVAQPLRAGTVLEASILLDTRRLYEWVLEPLFTLTGRV